MCVSVCEHADNCRICNMMVLFVCGTGVFMGSGLTRRRKGERGVCRVKTAADAVRPQCVLKGADITTMKVNQNVFSF